jgi:non-homologous end joining protein Ku
MPTIHLSRKKTTGQIWVIRDAMSRAKVVGLARVVLSSRERPFEAACVALRCGLRTFFCWTIGRA